MVQNKLFLVLAALVAADIPVHCLRTDYAGEWEFTVGGVVKYGHQTDAVPSFPSELGDTFCDGNSPNLNRDNQQENRVKFLIPKAKIQVHLSNNMTTLSNGDDAMIAHSSELKNAHWTTAYDEGFEVQAIHKSPMTHEPEDVRFLALSKYVCADGSPVCGENDEGEDKFGRTKGYVSKCGQTIVGWYHVVETSGRSGFGCWYGTRTDMDSETPTSFVMEEDHPKLTMKLHTVYHRTEFKDGVLPSYSTLIQIHNNDLNRAKAFKPIRRPASIRRVSHKIKSMMKVRDPCVGNSDASKAEVEKMEERHPIWDWRQEYNGAVATPITNQRACGSCYAVALTYVLESRVNIERARVAKDNGKPQPESIHLSPHSVLACSYYNQGCSGGYPFVVGKHAQEFGIVEESCQPYGSAGDGDVEACRSKCFENNNAWMAKDYKYIGGFYGVCGQEKMMKSLKENGPIAVALEVPAEFTFDDTGDSVIGGSSFNQGSSFTQGNDAPDGDGDDGDNLRKEQHTAMEVDHRGNVRIAASPPSHIRMKPDGDARYFDVFWRRSKAKTCQTDVTPHDVNQALRKEFGDAFEPQEFGSFRLDSDMLAVDFPMANKTESVLAKSLGIYAACLKVQIFDAAINGWEYTNHAIVVVGWGQREDGNGNTEKYWIIRNSWGKSFGDNGYGYVIRGKDYAGLESQSVEVTVDKNRGAFAKWAKDFLSPDQTDDAAAQADSDEFATTMSGSSDAATADSPQDTGADAPDDTGADSTQDAGQADDSQDGQDSRSQGFTQQDDAQDGGEDNNDDATQDTE